MEKNNSEDFNLIEQFLNGDENSFKTLFEKYSQRVLSLVYSYTKNYDDAKDITQEIFLKVYNSLENFKKRSSFSTWLYRITLNESISFLRKMKKEKNLVSIDEVNEIEIQNNSNDQNNYDRGLMEKILLSLPENQKIAFILAKKEQLSYREIGKIMNISEKAVESLIYRARENIRNFLKNELG